MTQHGIAVPTTADIDDQEQLVRVLEAVIETAENLVSHERQQRDDHDLGEQADLSALFALEDDDCDGFTLETLENALSSLPIEDHWQHDNWEPGDPCPHCGGTKFSVIEPREYFHTYDEEQTIVNVRHGDASAPAMNYWCVGCNTHLSGHPAMALFFVE